MIASRARFVVDIGNTRVKFARLDPSGSIGPARAFDAADPPAWDDLGADSRGGQPVALAVSSVNPAARARLATWIASSGVPLLARWYGSAADVPVRHDLAAPESTGADRALAVLAAVPLLPDGCGWVLSCGTAITVERIDAGGIWRGGAIAAGIGLLARALNAGTAQLPLVVPAGVPRAWGAETHAAIEAGTFWGAVGAARELLTRQGADPSRPDPIVWTGGDAARLAPEVCGPEARIVPDLVLRGLARAAFGADLG